MSDGGNPGFGRARAYMVDAHLRGRGIRDKAVLDAMATVPREMFVPASRQAEAYSDAPIPIGEGQTISQPYVVALMAEAAQLRPGDRVLEVGAGSGYAAAVMSRIAGSVHAIERLEPLSSAAAERMRLLGYDNVHVLTGDGTLGLPEAAPFDAIVVSAGGPAVPEALRQQLAVGGRLVIPVGERASQQRLLRIIRTGDETFSEQDLGIVRFVPLIGRQGWPANSRRVPRGYSII